MYILQIIDSGVNNKQLCTNNTDKKSVIKVYIWGSEHAESKGL